MNDIYIYIEIFTWRKGSNDKYRLSNLVEFRVTLLLEL